MSPLMHVPSLSPSPLATDGVSTPQCDITRGADKYVCIRGGARHTHVHIVVSPSSARLSAATVATGNTTHLCDFTPPHRRRENIATFRSFDRPIATDSLPTALLQATGPSSLSAVHPLGRSGKRPIAAALAYGGYWCTCTPPSLPTPEPHRLSVLALCLLAFLAGWLTDEPASTTA